jgi:hypothetical protein
MREDWIDALVRQRQARAQRAREAATRRAEEDQREHFDQVWSCLGDVCRHAVDRYNAAVGVMHEVQFQAAPRGAMLIEKAAYPAGYLFLTADREKRVFRVELRFRCSEAAEEERLTDEGRLVVAGETLAFCWKGQPFGPEELARELLSALFEHI